jgi:alcohol dehydrogenase
MRALVFDGQLRLRDVPEPPLEPGEALIRPHLAGVCATDIQVTRGYKGLSQGEPRILGHEFVGTVVACEDESWVAQRVVGEINVACGACATCRRGDATHCPERSAIGIFGRDGAFAERLTLPISNLHRVPESIADEAAVFAEPLAAALQILAQTHVRPDERVAVVGDGRLGLLVAQALRLTGCDLLVVGRHPERWDLLRRQGIAATASIATHAERGFDLVVDCTGQPGGLDTARRLVRPRGRLALKSTFHGAVELDLAPLVVDEITIIGSRCGPFDAALRLLERGLIETEPLISAIVPLAEAEQALEMARGALKILVRVTGNP